MLIVVPFLVKFILCADMIEELHQKIDEKLKNIVSSRSYYGRQLPVEVEIKIRRKDAPRNTSVCRQYVVEKPFNDVIDLLNNLDVNLQTVPKKLSKCNSCSPGSSNGLYFSYFTFADFE